MIEPSVLENRNYSIPEESAESHTAGELEWVLGMVLGCNVADTGAVVGKALAVRNYMAEAVLLESHIFGVGIGMDQVDTTVAVVDTLDRRIPDQVANAEATELP